jgi:hypothetical protein
MQKVQLYKTIYYRIVDLLMIAHAGDVTIPAIILVGGPDVSSRQFFFAAKKIKPQVPHHAHLCAHLTPIRLSP